jgi:Kef-type K+ transport system membrane component KefB
MSAVATTGKTRLGKGIDALGLVLVFAMAYAATRLAPGVRTDVGVIGALGFLLLAGTLMGEMVEMLGAPHLTGYLLAGLVAGPHVLALVDTLTVKRLAPINTLALALIALAGGAELHLDQVRKAVKSLAIATAIQSLGVAIAVASVFYLARPLIPFAADMTPSALLAVGLLWGVLSTTRSPSATLAILTQTRAKGPVASFALAFVMLSDVAVILMLALALMIAKPMIEPGAAFSFSAFHALGHEIVGSVSIGTTLGLLLAAYLRVVGKQLLVVLFAVGFGATEVLHFLQFDPLLTFMVAGFVVQNLSKQGEKFLHAIDATGGVVYVLFFAIAGADLDIPLLKSLWPVALLLAGARSVITYGGARLASAVAKDGPMVSRWAWTSLIAQAGLTQGLAGVVERAYPTFGAPFRALVFANVALNAVIGPILFKLGLDSAKESKGPAASLSDEEP